MTGAISSTSDMSALPLLKSNIVSTATTDVSSVASAQTSVLAPASSIPMVLTTNSDDLVSPPVLSALQKRFLEKRFLDLLRLPPEHR
jgi:hypothetical protein